MIELSTNEDPVTINPDNICWVVPANGGGCTIMFTCGEWLHVKDTYEEVADMLRLGTKMKPKAKKPPLAPPVKKNTFNPADAELPFDTLEFRMAWSAWCEHRNEIKKPLTKTMVEQQLKKMEKWGEKRSIVTILHTVSNGWWGLHEPKEGEEVPVTDNEYDKFGPFGSPHS